MIIIYIFIIRLHKLRASNVIYGRFETHDKLKGLRIYDCSAA